MALSPPPAAPPVPYYAYDDLLDRRDAFVAAGNALVDAADAFRAAMGRRPAGRTEVFVNLATGYVVVDPDTEVQDGRRPATYTDTHALYAATVAKHAQEAAERADLDEALAKVRAAGFTVAL